MGGMRADDALNLAKAYVKKTLQGQGALKGQDGFSPIIEENADNTDKIYKLDITTANSAFTTPNLRGKDGEGSGGGEANVIESISVNGTPISVDENKNVDITVPSIDGLAKTEDIPTKVSELTNDSNYQTAEQVNSTVITEISKVVADAPEDLNTLKEMSDWIAGHENDASAMNSAISDNKTAITALQTGKADKTEIPTTLPADGGNSDTVNNHTVESDVPVDAKFTDTVYDDTDIKEEFTKVDNKLTTNLLKPTLGTVTKNGVTCTNNGDGTYTLNGTATATIDITLCATNIKNNKSYMCVGCPSGGSTESYYLYFDFFVDTTWKKVLNDIGNGVKVDNTEYNIVKTHIKILSGQTVSNLVFKPMVTTNLNATYDDFVPYTGSTGQINSDVAELKNDLGGLTFYASGTTLSITDGTNTWTLEAN